MTDAQEGFIAAVLRERTRQNNLWGQQDHAYPFWAAILMRKVGEVARAITYQVPLKSEIMHELVGVAAVCCAMAECIMREVNNQ